MTESLPASAGDFTPADRFTITSLEQLKVFADPLRQQIIDALLDHARTVKQVAAQLEMAPTKLYYHFNLLEEHGFISVADTRIVSGIIEKQYRASARSYLIKRTLLNPHEAETKTEAIQTLLDAVFEPIRAEITAGIQSGLISTAEDAPNPRKISVWREFTVMTEADAEEFHARLQALTEEFHERTVDAGASGATTGHYQLLIALYPRRSPSGEDAAGPAHGDPD